MGWISQTYSQTVFYRWTGRNEAGAHHQQELGDLLLIEGGASAE